MVKKSSFKLDLDDLYKDEPMIRNICLQFCNLPLIDLLKRMLDFNPQTRITLKEALNHQFF